MTTRVRTFALSFGAEENGEWRPGRLKVIAQGDDGGGESISNAASEKCALFT